LAISRCRLDSLKVPPSVRGKTHQETPMSHGTRRMVKMLRPSATHKQRRYSSVCSKPSQGHLPLARQVPALTSHLRLQVLVYLLGQARLTASSESQCSWCFQAGADDEHAGSAWADGISLWVASTHRLNATFGLSIALAIEISRHAAP
jgi:hypothetical protein